MNTAIIVLVVVAIVVYGVMQVILIAKKHKYETELERQAADQKANERKKNEAKEKMDSGNSKRDFNASVDILHDLSKK